MSKPTDDSSSSGVRLDLWLWAARFFKTRALAKHAIEGGKVEVDARPCKPATVLRAGEMLRIARAEERFEVLVLALSAQRGSASAAQTLYRETEASRITREAERERRRMEATGYRAPLTKPDKRARRLIHALGDIDAQ
ncbi:MAG: RNA-binding S4 domain-containing protein [Lysobacteraceae bacterium]